MTLKHTTALCCAIFGSMVAMATLGAQASAKTTIPPGKTAGSDTEDAVFRYWTPERLAHAKPVGLMSTVQTPTIPAKGERPKPQIFYGGEPVLPYDASLSQRLFEEARPHYSAPPPLVGSSGLPFTTNRVYPQTENVLHKIYPYATFGQLYFTEPSGDFVCSASVIRAGTIATAGHCVADGNGHYYSNWLFVPAENGSLAPFGKWGWSFANVSSAWWSGGGSVPNEQDDAIIVLAKHKGNSIGNYVGYLGYEYNTPLPTAVTQIGYPCNLDSCVDPVATYAQDNSGPSNNFQWGTASFGGASGGPEIQDFGQAPSGVPTEVLGGNIVVSSTSYTYTASGVDEDGGSIFYAPGQNGEFTFGDLINQACSHGGC